MRHPINAVLLCGILAGCNAVVVQDEPSPRQGYYEREFDQATSKGAIYTIVAGNPFGVSKKEFDALVRGLMYNQTRELAADFVDNPNERTSPPYKVVVAFNKKPSVSPGDLCANPFSVPTVAEKKELRIDISFCYGDTSKSDTSGYARNVSGTDHPNFASLVRQATFTMLPEPGDFDREASENEARP